MDLDANILSSLADMYSKNGRLADSGKVFSGLSSPDVVSWSAMIDAYAQHDDSEVALQVFVRMLQAPVEPNEATFLGILRACRSLDSQEWLKCVYCLIIEVGLETNVPVGSALVDTFANLKSLEDAYFVFTKLANKNVVAWAAIISGFLDGGQLLRALQLLNDLFIKDIEPNIIVCLCALKACSSIEDIEQGLMMHVLIVQMAFESDKAIGNTLIDCYAKNGDLDSAHSVFCSLSSPDAVSFGALIAGYSRQGWNALALNLYDQMQKKDILPDSATFLSLLKSCGSIGAVGQGRVLHGQIVLNGLESALFVKNAIVDMYARTKNLDEARHVLASHVLADRESHDVVSCSSIIGGLKHQVDLEYLMQFVQDVLQEGCDPDNTMLTSILMSCSRAGLLNEGYDLFTSICECNPLILMQEHYSSTVDLLGRGGQLQLAADISATMPMPPDVTTITCLLATSKTYSSVEQCNQYTILVNP